MKQKLNRSLLCLFLLCLSGCNILEMVRNSTGVYSGKNHNGKNCEVQVSLLELPSGLCRWATVALSTDGSTLQMKRFCLGTTESYQPTQFLVMQGSPQNPQRVSIEQSTVIDFHNQKIRAVTFLDSKQTCRRLERK